MDSPDITSVGDSYQEVITSIIQRFGRLAGVPAALNVARKVPQLFIDDTGNVLGYNTGDPLGTISCLIDQYEVLYGEIARTLALQSAPTLVDAADMPKEPQSLTRIVLVDDHVLFREGLTRLLEAQPDMKVVGHAGTAHEGVAFTQAILPDLVLMDITLPDGTGVDATRLIQEVAPGTKVVILTVHEEEERLFEAIRAGAVGYLFKSVRAAELIETLRGVMRGEAGLHGSMARRVLNEFARLSPTRPVSEAMLTLREIEVLRELANGLSNQAIAQRLIISENTVKNHIRNVLVKLNFHSRHEAADYARRHGLTSIPFPP